MWKAVRYRVTGRYLYYTETQPLSFALTVRSGKHAVELLHALSTNHTDTAELIDVLIEAIGGASMRRTTHTLERMITMFDTLEDTKGEEAFAITTFTCALRAHISMRTFSTVA